MDFGSFMRKKEQSQYGTSDVQTSSASYSEYGTGEGPNFEQYGSESSYESSVLNNSIPQRTDEHNANYDNSYHAYGSSFNEPFSGNTNDSYQNQFGSHDQDWNASHRPGPNDDFATSAHGQPTGGKFGQQGANTSRGGSRGRSLEFNRGRNTDRGHNRGRGKGDSRGRGREFRGRGQQQFGRGAHRGSECGRGSHPVRGERGTGGRGRGVKDRGRGARGRGLQQDGGYDIKENPQEAFEQSGHMSSMEENSNQSQKDEETNKEMRGGSMWDNNDVSERAVGHTSDTAETKSYPTELEVGNTIRTPVESEEKRKEDDQEEESEEEEEDKEIVEAIEKLPARHNRGLMSTLIGLAGTQVLNRKPDPLPPPVPMKLEDDDVNRKKATSAVETKDLIEAGVTPTKEDNIDDSHNPTETRDLLPDEIGRDSEKSEFFCKLCQVQTTSASNLRDHVNGRAHKSTFEAFKLGKKRPLTKSQKRTLRDPSEIGQRSIILDMVADYKEPILGLSFITEYHSSTGIMCVCNLCGVKFDHNITISHVAGTKHRCHYVREKKPDVYLHVRKFAGKKSQLNAFLEELCVDVEKEDGRGNPVLKVYHGANKNKNAQPYEEGTDRVGKLTLTTEEKDDGSAGNNPTTKMRSAALSFEAWVDEEMQKSKQLWERKETLSPTEGFKDDEEDHSFTHGSGRSRLPRGRGHIRRDYEIEMGRYDDPYHPPPFAPHPPLEPYPPFPHAMHHPGFPYDSPYPPRNPAYPPMPHPYDDPYLDPLRRVPPRPDPHRDPAFRADPYLRHMPSRHELYLNPDPLKRFPPKTPQEPYLDPDPLKRLRKPEPYLDPDPLKRAPPKKQAAVSKPLVFDYGHQGGEKGKSKLSTDQWEDDIKNILGQSGKSRAPDSLALLSSTYSSPERSPSPKQTRRDSKPTRELPFSKPYIEMPEAQERLKGSEDHKHFKEASSRMWSSQRNQDFRQERRKVGHRESPPRRSDLKRAQGSGFSNYLRGPKSRSKHHVHPRSHRSRTRSPSFQRSYKSKSKSPDDWRIHKSRSRGRDFTKGRKSISRSPDFSRNHRSRSPDFSRNHRSRSPHCRKSRRSSSRSPDGSRKIRPRSPQARNIKRKYEPGKSESYIEILDSPEDTRSRSPSMSYRVQSSKDPIANHHNKIVEDILAEADEETQAEKIADMLLQMSSSLSDQEDAQGALRKLFSNPELTSALLSTKEKASEAKHAGTSAERKFSDRDEQPRQLSRSPSDYYKRIQQDDYEKTQGQTRPPPSREKVAFSFSGFGRLQNTLPSAFRTEEDEDEAKNS